MYLKRLNLLGFKSFANKTSVHFSNGITAIVGPNGCGKTNILDALRWVLGEQKVTLLRGSKMEEVIFNGTRDMKPLGMAEVTLSLVNNRGVLPTEYGEVQITRRLFRSGESEYLLNKVPCRLKDIHELFYDTGVGAHSYSVIQQEMIDAVISDKAEERRFLFEEAAGITKYKQRKKAALRKLEATENDLLRLRDIYAEVQTQARSLNRQQKKAQRYQAVLEDIKDWELFFGTSRLRQIEAEKRELKAQLEALTDQRTEKEAALSRITSQLEADRKEQVDLEQELTATGNEVYEVSEKAHSLEREISILVEKRSNARKIIERNQNDVEALNARTHILAEQTEQTKRDITREQIAHEALQQQLKEAEADQADTDQRLLATRSSREQENSRLIDLEGKLSSGKTEEENLREQEQELSRLISELDTQLEQNHAARTEIKDELEIRSQTLVEITSKKETAEKSRDELSRQIEQAIEKGEELSLEISNVSASIEACQARRNLLEDMIVHYEGYSSGAVAIMDIKDRWSGIAGTVAEKFVPAEGFEVAVEAALGEMAGFLICTDRTTAEQIIEYLRSENKGKVGVLVPDTGTLNPVVKRPELEMPEFAGWLDSFVTADQELLPLMQAVLSRVAVFKAGTDPQNILARLPYGFSAVSTDGTVYSKNIISGGSEDKFPLFRRKEKVAEQERMIAELDEKLRQIRGEKDRQTVAIATDRAESSRLSDLLETLNEEANTASQKVNELSYRRQSLETEISRLEKERQNQFARQEKIRHRQYTLGLDYNQLTNAKENLVSSMSQGDTALQNLDSAAAAALERVSRLHVELVESRSRIEQIESKMTHLQELRQEIFNTVEARKTEIEKANAETEFSANRIAEMEGELKAVFRQRTEATEHQTLLRSKQAEILKRVSSREEQLKATRTEKESLGENSHQLEIRVNTLDSEIKSLGDRIREEYDVEIHSIQLTRPDDRIAGDEARAYLAEQKERLKKFGPVNLLALEEYRHACEREKFLGEQLDDLTSAKDDLKATIIRINKTAKQLFVETFDKVRINFRKLFVDLFSGGEADIILEDPNDPLESDIHIIARPRGKKLLSITMMSGGERALTAIALLFGLYLVKPSPFCILDEIDAPLDDANCHRFLNIIRNFSRHTQFIIITHNKITMAAASNLYGITMEKAGISKLVAVKFTDVERDERTGSLIIKADTALEPPSALQTAGEGTAGAESIPGRITEREPDLPEEIAQRINPDVSVTDDHETDA